MHMIRSTQQKAEAAAREALYGSRLFLPARSAYQRLFHRERWQFWETMAGFYSRLIPRDALVFDVGANVGMYSELFLQLGAEVVAVEPNEACYSQLRRVAKGHRMSIEKVACGARAGTADLHLSDASGICTISEQWVDITQKSDLYSESHWLGVKSVPLTTLDALAAKYGEPRYVKIDVEGYDNQVLEGMSFLPPSLSFEYHTSMPQVASACLERLAANYVFNYVIANQVRFELERWIEAAEMKRILAALPAQPDFGDVYGRRCA
jgi:FkbM family methyltransferase